MGKSNLSRLGLVVGGRVSRVETGALQRRTLNTNRNVGHLQDALILHAIESDMLAIKVSRTEAVLTFSRRLQSYIHRFS